MKYFFSFILFITLKGVFAADLNLDPTFLRLKVYKFSVSSNVLCTNPITIFENSSPDYQDVLSAPDFGNGSIADGDYPCVIIEFSDNIKFSPNANSDSGNCATGSTYTLDVCGSSSSDIVTMTDGSTKTCDGTEQIITMYLSTTSTSSSGGSGNAFSPPTTIGDSTKGLKLGNGLVVSGSSTGQFVVNGTDKICDTDAVGCNGAASACEMGPPLFSFSQN